MANTYEELKKSLAGFEAAGELYDRIRHYEEVPKLAASLAAEEGDETSAQLLLDPNTPFEKKVPAVRIFQKNAQRKLEELVENKFDEILNETSKGVLEASLLSFSPKKDLKGKYEELAKYHNVQRNLALYQARKSADKREVSAALGTMTNDVIEHYNEKYKFEKGDSDEDKSMKEMLREFFLSLYVDSNGKPTDEGMPIAGKYLKIHEEGIKNFNEGLKEKSALVDYITKTLPEDKESRINFLRAIVSIGS